MENLIFDRIKEEISDSDVVLFMKGTPVFPQCGFSAAVTNALTPARDTETDKGGLRAAFYCFNPRARQAAWCSMPLSASNCFNSPDSYISRTISQPPTNSPLT